jgi:hypothetical protein
MFRGTVTFAVTLPLASERNGKVRTVLSSCISPIWLAGTWLAVAKIVSPGVTVYAESESVVLPWAAR